MMRKRINAYRIAAISLGLCLALGLMGTSARAGDIFKTTNLVSDGSVPAQITDPNLVNAWGISYGATSPFWVSDNGTGVSTLYSVNPTTNATAIVPLVVSIPGEGNPTGQVFNSAAASGAFNKDVFLFVSEDGTISGWKGGTSAEVLQLGSANNVYKGVTLDTTGGNSYLLSANFRAGTIDVMKGVQGTPDLTGNFTDPGLPGGYAPFNIQLINGKIYVSYAVQDAAKEDDVAGAGHGLVSVFDLNGNFLQRLIAPGGMLNSPWGMVIAPSSFGSLAGDLLVGNFGDGTIDAFNPKNGSFAGQLMGPDGKPLVIDGLWGLIAGNGGAGGSKDNIYFSAGPNGESNGLFGVIQSVPEPSSAILGLIAVGVLAGGWRYQSRRQAASI